MSRCPAEQPDRLRPLQTPERRPPARLEPAPFPTGRARGRRSNRKGWRVLRRSPFDKGMGTGECGLESRNAWKSRLIPLSPLPCPRCPAEQPDRLRPLQTPERRPPARLEPAHFPTGRAGGRRSIAKAGVCCGGLLLTKEWERGNAVLNPEMRGNPGSFPCPHCPVQAPGGATGSFETPANAGTPASRHGSNRRISRRAVPEAGAPTAKARRTQRFYPQDGADDAHLTTMDFCPRISRISRIVSDELRPLQNHRGESCSVRPVAGNAGIRRPEGRGTASTLHVLQRSRIMNYDSWKFAQFADSFVFHPCASVCIRG